MDKESVDFKNIIVIGLIKGKGDFKNQFMFVKEPDGTILFPGGKVKVNESLTDALRREIIEETGFEVTSSRIACIEHASVWEDEVSMVVKSMLLYFFDVSIVAGNHLSDANILWMGRKEIESSKAAVPYDNLLIARDLPRLDPGIPFVVPPGFRDSPGETSRTAIRTFCWISGRA